MADFQQLALQFVLEDDETKLTHLAQVTASELQHAPANSNPVARWVEAVQPWMPGHNDDSADSQETPDWTSRAKALEFLSRTLEVLSPDLLKPSQVKLLVAFFGAMFDVDHKAGILASATALSRIIAMKSFQSSSGYDIIQKVCALKDDFPRQVAKTRLAVYELLRSLITAPSVALDLQNRDSAAAGFMVKLLDLCRSERDPDCLDAWFDTLRQFLQMYENISQEVVGEVYGAFKSYYPITLPRTSQSGMTPDQLKQRLRKCFSSSHRLASLAFPFLIGKLDQGDGVTVNVKLDVLKTIRACLEEYTHAEQSIIPYVNRIWSSLKYEVRNGEVEDTMWATLEVLKTLATKLQDDDLRDYTLNVTRDCVNDLSNPLYTAPSGRLLVSVLSASPSAFVLMVAPTITHVKENLRHPKSPAHAQDLLKLLFVILETRVLLANMSLSNQDKTDFAAVDGTIKSLYRDVYKASIELACKEDATDKDIKNTTEAVQGVGALMSQRLVSPLDSSSERDEAALLVPEETCFQICNDLFGIILQSFTRETQKSQHDLINETAKALQRSLKGYPSGFKPLVDQALDLMRADRASGQVGKSVEAIQTLGPLLGYVGCLEVSHNLASGMQSFLYLFCSLTAELITLIDLRADPKIWCALLAGIQAVARYFNDALPNSDAEEDQPPRTTSWTETVVEKYPILSLIGESGDRNGPLQDSRLPLDLSVSEARSDLSLITLFVVRCLYRRATSKVDAAHSRTGEPVLRLSDEFSGSNRAVEYQYLYLLSGLASFVVHGLSESQQLSLHVEEYALNLFQDETIHIPEPLSEKQSVSEIVRLAAENGSSCNWLIGEGVNVLTLGVLEGLRNPGVGRLFNNGVPHELLISGTIALPKATGDSWTRPVARSILAILANKYEIEKDEVLMTVLNQQLINSIKNAKAATNTGEQSQYLEQVSSIYAITSGTVRRCGGKQARDFLQTLREAPNDSSVGHHLARRLEMIVAPQRFLTKEQFAVVKPLWMQRLFTDLIKPMIPTAVGANAEIEDPLIKTNFSIGVLLMVKHLPFSVYEDDAGQILRISIAVAQNLRIGSDKLAALQVLKEILAESPETAQDHVQSLVTICHDCLSTSQRSRGTLQPPKPSWIPEGYLPTENNVEAGCDKLALEMLAVLPSMLETRYVLPFARKVRNSFIFACGHGVRDLRRIARVGLAAWQDVK